MIKFIASRWVRFVFSKLIVIKKYNIAIANDRSKGEMEERRALNDKVHNHQLNAVVTQNIPLHLGAFAPTRTITYHQRTFALWDNPAGHFVEKVRLQPIDFIADTMLRNLSGDIGIEYVKESGAEFVVIKAHYGEFLGAEAGKISSNLPGIPTYTFHFEGYEIGVWKNNVTGVIHEVRLLSENFVPFHQFHDHPYLKTHCFFKDGAWMLVHSIVGKVLGAQLLHEPCQS
ncbi:uncharacterized protein LOC117175314 [Belonocnema kinseyi]|uniref:uncharacterized protein LOC117175314 n=1 Tax=Belonocnema kinseyi TaxID=2817044 RepID=UPI00143DDE96|nr:uncharacterized protein LOC117175314 [Belonocnema kinseyi]